MSVLHQKEVFWASFPYSHLGEDKQRPVLVVSNDEYNASGDDVVVCAITSNLKARPYSVPLDQSGFVEGKLPLNSRIRCDKILGLEKTLLGKKMGRVTDKVFQNTLGEISRLLHAK